MRVKVTSLTSTLTRRSQNSHRPLPVGEVRTGVILVLMLMLLEPGCMNSSRPEAGSCARYCADVSRQSERKRSTTCITIFRSISRLRHRSLFKAASRSISRDRQTRGPVILDFATRRRVPDFGQDERKNVTVSQREWAYRDSCCRTLQRSKHCRNRFPRRRCFTQSKS